MYGASNDGNETAAAADDDDDDDVHATYGDRKHTVMTVRTAMVMNVAVVVVDN